MSKQFEKLTKMIDIKGLENENIYVSYFNNVKELQENGFHDNLDINSEEFQEELENKYTLIYDEVTVESLMKPFVEFDEEGTQSRLFFVDDNLVDNVINWMENESSMKRYVK